VLGYDGVVERAEPGDRKRLVNGGPRRRSRILGRQKLTENGKWAVLVILNPRPQLHFVSNQISLCCEQYFSTAKAMSIANTGPKILADEIIVKRFQHSIPDPCYSLKGRENKR
jgi:hypothetical protein